MIVYDYKNDACWVWDNFEAEYLFKVENAADDDQIYFANREAVVYQFTGKHDYGTPIEASITTHRIGRDIENAKMRSIYLLGSNLDGEVTAEVSVDDAPFLETKVSTFDFNDAVEKNYDVAQYDVTHYTEERDRQASQGVMEQGNWFKLKVSHSEKDKPFILNEIMVGMVPLSPRR